MASRNCAVDGCDRSGYLKRGWCNTHYERWRLKGTTDDPVRPVRSCSVEGCKQKHAARGYCQSHYSRLVRGVRSERTCSVAGCAESASRLGSGRGYCPKHYQRWKTTGDPEGTICRKHFCEVSECGRPAFGRKMCRLHWGRWHRRMNPELYADRDHRRRARLLGADSEDVERLVVFERDGWVCQLCGDPIDKTLRHPDPLSPSLDHRVPLVKGGAHSYANTQAAHLTCNLRKGARAA